MEVTQKPENDSRVVEMQKCPGDGPALHPSNAPQISCTRPSRGRRFTGREWYYGNLTRHQAQCTLN
ncbi:Cytoplasmic protein NCK2 [Sciurus carolinensis]|uniref:Cytoplasmic protein NCK2 n=1 Tax=Sciurus carolinensis TaxID=30640 RepID=A0AA41MIR3_SCICA|nr:Cytoplasmic protein NCK2 [Sciurus carolinensis]